MVASASVCAVANSNLLLTFHLPTPLLPQLQPSARSVSWFVCGKMFFPLFSLVFLCVGLATANPLKRFPHVLGNRGSAQLDFLVTSLPGLSDNVAENDVPLMFAGQLELYAENNTHYFFWKFAESRKAPDIANRTIFWLNGGPGCSSMDGALMEAGPFRVDGNLKVVSNPGSWHKKGDIVFVDQPSGTGFSYSNGYDAELYQVETHFLRFLQKYFELFPEDADNEIVLAGESYAGQYIPYIAHGVLRRNRNVPEGERPYALKGLLIGNGWISPNDQALSYVPFAVQAGLTATDKPSWAPILKQHMKCQDLVAAASTEDTFGTNSVVDKECEKILNVLLYQTLDAGASKNEQCINMYDYTLRDSYPSCGMNWPPDLANVNPFLHLDQVKSDLNLINKVEWRECSGAVGSHLKARQSQPSIVLFPDLLSEVEIVLFHGNRDIICNYIGAEDMIKRLRWGGLTGFSANVEPLLWFHSGQEAGYVKSDRNLTLINVFNASHMVPFDRPEVSAALVDILFKKYDVADGKLETDPKTSLLLDLPYAVNATSTNSTVTSADSSADSSTNSKVVRLIQLAVVIILIWGICALYSTYRSKPTSIIKTKASGRKKNVQWADLIPNEEEHPKGFFSKALSKLSRSDNPYAPVANEDIELGTAPPDDEFIIASDDDASEEPTTKHSEHH